MTSPVLKFGKTSVWTINQSSQVNTASPLDTKSEKDRRTVQSNPNKLKVLIKNAVKWNQPKTEREHQSCRWPDVPLINEQRGPRAQIKIMFSCTSWFTLCLTPNDSDTDYYIWPDAKSTQVLDALSHKLDTYRITMGIYPTQQVNWMQVGQLVTQNSEWCLLTSSSDFLRNGGWCKNSVPQFKRKTHCLCARAFFWEKPSRHNVFRQVHQELLMSVGCLTIICRNQMERGKQTFMS